MRAKMIAIDLYRQDLIVFVGTRRALRRYLWRKLSYETYRATWQEIREPSREAHDACTYKLESNANLIHIKRLSLEVLTHELYHATHNILNWIGVHPSDDSEEAYAYLIGYLMSQCEELLTTTC